MDLENKRFAVLSDAHGNIEGLNTALRLIQKRNVDYIFFLGDSIGYGANPLECYKKLKNQADVFLMGNHEAMMIIQNLKMSSLCKESYTWTEKKLDLNIKTDFKSLEHSYHCSGISFYHAHPDNSITYWPYMNSKQEILCAFEKEDSQACFYGHTHRPRITIVGGEELDEFVKKNAEYEVNLEECRCFINPGSVGQQRDEHTDISFVICELQGKTLKVCFERHKYNSLKAYLKTRFCGCGINNANYLIREKWRRKLYEGIGNWSRWFYR